MDVTVERLTPHSLLESACTMTLRPGATSTVSFEEMLRCEHSPIRTQIYWIKLLEIPTFISVHLVRHKIGVEHFVQSMRRNPNQTAVNRLTPVNHGMLINAQALIQMSRKRLCLKSAAETVAVWTNVRKRMKWTDSMMASFMVPECVYRNGMCPEIKQCRPGTTKVCSAYPKWVDDPH